ncbi:MlaD family protein [Nitrosophilus alvini]|uniref:MlaD family protein n=1 Tax=Nitrosophilus alvini TaxID=2714855 RepID=UPI001909C54E|nr:MlaD family protein [Nitrosophilus alvini]
MKTEAKVGVFVAIGLLFLFLLSTQVNKFANLGKKGYTVYAYLEDASGLEVNSKVRINGVEVGYVKDMSLAGKKVKADLFIYENVKIPKDSTLQLMQEGMLGNKYLNIIPGNSQEYVKPEENLVKQKIMASFDETSSSIDEAAKEFKEFIKELRADMKGANGDDLKQSIANLREITDSIKAIIGENRENLKLSIGNLKIMAKELSDAGRKFGEMSDKFALTADNVNERLPQIMKKVENIASSLENVGENLERKLPDIMERFASLEEDLQDIIKENKKPLSNAIKSADTFFSSGGETFKKLDKYFTAIGQSQLQVAFRTEYMNSDDYYKNYASIYYLPSPTKYYMLDIVSMDDYTRKDSSGNIIEPTLHEDQKVLVSAQYGRRFDDVLMRLGLIESTGGVGIDYFMYNDKMKISFDAYDFNAVNDVRGDKAHLKLGFRYRFLKHLDAVLGYDNFLNSKAANFYFGIGIGFIDNDLKALLGTAGSAGTYLK